MTARITAFGVLSAYGSGMQALVRGIQGGPARLTPATGIGYPGEPPLINRISDPELRADPALCDPVRGDPAPGERGARDALLQTVGQMMQARGLDTAADDCALIVGSGGFLYASNAELFWRDHGGGAAIAGAAEFRVRGPGWGAELIGAHWNPGGPVLTLSTGCSASANALLTALRWIRRGRVRRAIVVGAEGLGAVTLSGFDSLMLLDPQGCRPFDRDRAGVQLGEAVAALMIESDSAGTETSPSGARLLGAANRCDTHHLTSASPDGSVMAAVMRAALADAGLSTADVVAIKAHGTGSADSDAAEANAIRALFGVRPPPVTALKRYFGHTLGACGALETAAMIGCLGAGFIPAAAGFTNADPRLTIAPLRASQASRPGACLLNFFGFGGNYTSLVLSIDRESGR